MEWSLAIAPALVALAVLIIPGLLVTAAAGLKGFDALGAAPAVSVAVVALSAIAAPLVGVGWSPWVPLLFALICAAALYTVTALARRFGILDFPRNDAVVPNHRWFSPGQAWAYAAVALGAIFLTRNITNAIGYSTWVSQTYDANFHLNAIRYIVDTSNASSLHLASMTAGDNPVAFYPAAWHGIAALILQTTEAETPVIANAFTLIINGVIWPLTLVYLMRNLAKLSGPALLATGILSAAYIGFPLLLIYFGVLYPNALSITLMPVGLALVAQLFRVVQIRRIETVPAVLLGILTALGIALAHPNGIMTLLVLLAPLFITAALRQIYRAITRRTTPLTAAGQVLGLAGILGLIWFLWGVVRPPKEAGGWEPTTSQTTAVGEFLLNNATGQGQIWLVSLLALIGIYSTIRNRSNLIWLVGTWAYAGYFYVAIRSMKWDDGRDWVTGVWYHDPFRVASIIPLVSIPLGALAVDYLVKKLTTHAALTRIGKPALALGIITTLTTGGLAFGTQNAAYLRGFINYSFWTHEPDPGSPLLTGDEYDVLYALDEYVPDDATIIVNPWTGAGLAYAFSGRKVTAYHTNYSETDDTETLNRDLNRVFTDPAVCDTINRHNARYAIYFGTQEINEHVSGKHSLAYNSLEYLADPAVIDSGQVADVIYRSGGATLYKITACD